MNPGGAKDRKMVFIPKFRVIPTVSYNLDRLAGENNVLIDRIIREMESCNQNQLPTAPSQQFCAFCLRARLPNVEFYKHIVGSTAELRKSLQALLGYEFRLENFAICKPCWKIMQLNQDFRLRCMKANKLAERRFSQGLGSEDGWFSARNLATIESLRMVVKDQLLQIEKVDVMVVVPVVSELQQSIAKGVDARETRLEVGDVKVEPAEVDVSTTHVLKIERVEPEQQVVQNDSSVKPTQKSTLDVDKIKVEPDIVIDNKRKELIACISLDSEESDTAEATTTTNGVQEHLETTLDVGDVKVEPDYLILSVELEQPTSPSKDFETEAESDGWEDEISDASTKADESGLLQCKKCHRMFEPTGYKLHVLICTGKQPDRIYKCPECPITFTKHHKLVAHKNKHAGITPYKCRRNCERGFASAAVRNRHEIRCGIDVQKCMFCEKQLDNRLRLYEHYRLEHPGEPKFSCSQCDKRFKRKEHLQCHENRMHSSERPRELVCKVCDKAFAEKHNLAVHMKVHSDEKPYQCDQCGKQLKAKHSLDLHMASKHPELASEYGLKALARMQQRYKEVSSQRKQEKRVLKKRGPKPKKRKQETSSESEMESSEDYTEESETE